MPPIVDLGNGNTRLIKSIYSQYKSAAKRRGIYFEIPFPEFGEMILQNCAYCGAPPSNEKRDKRRGEYQRYNGLDRMDSSRGYVIENVVPCCQFCNSLKSAMPWRDWADFLNSVVELFGGNPPYPDERSAERAGKSFYFSRGRRRR